MNILAIETTGKYGSAAVITDDGAVFSAESRAEMNHLRGIISLIDDALKAAGISKEELTHIAASVGPGSFTGIRIGVVTARTMAQMLGIPCIAVSSLEAMAWRAFPDARIKGAAYVAPIINARRHQTYAGVYKALENVLEEKQYMIEELLGCFCHTETGEAELKKLADGPVFFIGDGIDAYEDIIRDTMAEGSYFFADEETRYQHAESVARIALAKAMVGDTISYDELLPEYMRLAEAEQRLKAGTLSDRISKPMV